MANDDERSGVMDKEKHDYSLNHDVLYRCLHCGNRFMGCDGVASGVMGEMIDACPNYRECGGAGLGVDVWEDDRVAKLDDEDETDDSVIVTDQDGVSEEEAEESRIIPDEAAALVFTTDENGYLRAIALFPKGDGLRGPQHPLQEDRQHVQAVLVCLEALRSMSGDGGH